MSPERPAARRTAAAWTLAALTAAALALRLLGAGRGLWFDEYAALIGAYRLGLGEIVTTWAGDFDHPLYSVLARLSLDALGESALSIRLPAILLGAATVPALYVLGREVRDRREGLLAAALLAVSYHHVWFSQNARGYAALALLAVLATYALLVGLRSGRLAPFAAYAVLAGIGLYAHLTMAFLVAGHAVACALVLVERRSGRPATTSDAAGRPAAGRLLVAFAGTGALALLLYAPIVPDVIGFFLGRPSGMRGVSTPGWALGEAFRSLRAGLGAGSLIGLLAVAVLLAAGAWSYLRSHRTAFWLFVLPVPVTVVGALLARGTMYPRFFFFLAGPAVLLLVRGAVATGAAAARLLERRRTGTRARRAAAWAPVAALLGLSLASLPLNYRWPKQDFESAVAYLDAEAARHAVGIVGEGAWPVHGFFERPYPRLGTVEELRGLQGEGGDVLLLYTFPRYVERSHPELWQAMGRCEVRRVFPGTVGGGAIVIRRCAPGAIDAAAAASAPGGRPAP